MATTTLLHLRRRAFSTSPSSILSPSNPTAVLTSKQKSLAAISLLKSLSKSPNPNPSQIQSIISASSPSPSSPLDLKSLSLASSLLSSSPTSLRHLLSSLPSDPKTTSHVIALYGRHKLLDDAFSTFKSHSPSLQTFNSLLFAALVAKSPDSATRFFREVPLTYHFQPNIDSYNTMVKVFAESGSTRSFYSLLDEMKKNGVKANATTFCNALVGFYREGKFDEVQKVLGVMKEWDCNPGAMGVYNVRILSLCKMKRTKEAMGLFREMVRKGVKPNWVGYGHLIVGFCKEGELIEATKVYGMMKERKLVAESGVYISLVHYLCLGGEFGMAVEVYEDALARNWVPGFKTMKILVEGLVKEGKVEKGKEIVGKMKERFPSNEEMWKEVEDGFPQ